MKQNKKIIIGVTGGVGAGKSTILNTLKNDFGACILLADDIAKELYDKGKASYNLLVSTYGDRILNEDQTLDYKKMTQYVFSDPVESKKINDLIHPIVVDEMKKRAKEAFDNGINLVVMEAALLIESGLYRVCDRLWYAYADEEVRTKRLMETRGYSYLKCKDIMAKQLSKEDFASFASDFINTEGSFEETKRIINEHMKICDILC